MNHAMMAAKVIEGAALELLRKAPTKERAEADAKVLTDRIALVLQHLVVNRSKKDGIWSRKAVAAKTAAEKAPKAPKPPADELEGDEVAT